MRPEPRPRSILVLRLSALGDVIHTLPAVNSLRAGWGEGVPIGWVCERPYVDLIQTVAPVDEVFEVDTRRWRSSPASRDTRREISFVVRRLREFSDCGWAIDFQGLLKSSIFGWLSSAERRYGFDRGNVREVAAMPFSNHRVAVAGEHVIDRNLELARAAGGVEVETPFLGLARLSADPRDAIVSLVSEPPIVILPGAGQERKQWPPDSWIHLLETIRERVAVPVLVVWGPGEKELAEGIAHRGGGVVAPETDLRDLGALLLGARLVVGGDTGPLHLAEAMGVPVVALHGPTDPRRNGPWRQQGSVATPSDRGTNMSTIDTALVVDLVMAALGV